jgi:hypothetical protein
MRTRKQELRGTHPKVVRLTYDFNLNLKRRLDVVRGLFSYFSSGMHSDMNTGNIHFLKCIVDMHSCIL